MSLIPILPRQPDIRQQFPIAFDPIPVDFPRLHRLRDGTAGFAVMQAGLEAALPDVRLKFRVQFLQFSGSMPFSVSSRLKPAVSSTRMPS